MRKVVAAVCALVALIAAYEVWPLYGLHRISNAVVRRDGADLLARVDVPSLKRSLGEQIARAYLRQTGKDKGLNDLQVTLAVRLATAMADARISEMVRAEDLIRLLGESGTGSFGAAGVALPRLEAPNLDSLFRFIAQSERAGRDFSTLVPLGADAATGYRLHLQLQGLTWKLTAIDLPEAVTTRIAGEIAKVRPG
jgi:hypothetical protein